MQKNAKSQGEDHPAALKIHLGEKREKKMTWQHM